MKNLSNLGIDDFHAEGALEEDVATLHPRPDRGKTIVSFQAGPKLGHFYDPMAVDIDARSRATY